MNKNLNDVIKKIKTRGYWKLAIEPIKPINNFFDHPTDVVKTIEQNKIGLRGWSYPHLPRENSDNEEVCIKSDRVDALIDYNHLIESWTFFQSGQFIHLLGLREDWLKESDWFERDSYLRKIEPMSILNFTGATLTLAEMFKFVTNISKLKKYEGKIKLNISLNNINNRKIQNIDQSRVPFYGNYSATTNEITVIEKIYSTTELEDKYLEFAEKGAMYLFKFFGLDESSLPVIREDQKKLLERRL